MCIRDRNDGHLLRAVVAEVKEDHHIVLFDGSHRIAIGIHVNDRLDEFIGNAIVVEMCIRDRDKGRDLKKIKGYSEDDVINRALDKREALEALELFYNLEIPVLGGDVFYVKDNDEIDWTNDNWYIDQLENETDVQFLKRSIEELSLIHI